MALRVFVDGVNKNRENTNMTSRRFGFVIEHRDMMTTWQFGNVNREKRKIHGLKFLIDTNTDKNIKSPPRILFSPSVSPPVQTVAQRLYFSDLTKEQLDRLFSKCHPLRFDLCSVIIYYNKFGKNPKLYGIIEACEQRGLRGDVLNEARSTTVGPSFSLFNRERNDSLRLPADKDFVYLHDMCFHSVPTHMAVRFIAKLYVMVDEMDIKDSDDRYVEVVEVERKEEGDVVKKYVFQVWSEEFIINFVDYLARRPNCPNYSYFNGHGGSVKLSYVALKYAVDASLEAEFVVTTSKETKVVGSIMAYFGKEFDYAYDPLVKRLCKAILFDTKTTDDDVSLKPGKINLLRSVLAVPANYSLIIDVNLRDLASGEVILKKPYEFLVPLDGSSNVGSIRGTYCLLNLKVDWKLPSEMLHLSSSLSG